MRGNRRCVLAASRFRVIPGNSRLNAGKYLNRLWRKNLFRFETLRNSLLKRNLLKSGRLRSSRLRSRQNGPLDRHRLAKLLAGTFIAGENRARWKSGWRGFEAGGWFQLRSANRGLHRCIRIRRITSGLDGGLFLRGNPDFRKRV